MIPGYGQISNLDLGIHGMPNAGQKLGTPYFSFSNFEALGATTDTTGRSSLRLSRPSSNRRSTIPRRGGGRRSFDTIRSNRGLGARFARPSRSNISLTLMPGSPTGHPVMIA